MVASWTLDELAAASGEPASRLTAYAAAGLLLTEADGRFSADALHRIRLTQFARRRGITDDELLAAGHAQGDLLGAFDELAPPTEATTSLAQAAKEAGVSDELLGQLVDLLGWEDVEVATDDDVAALQMLSQAISLGLPREAMVQLLRVFADFMDRLADAEMRIFHDYVHEQFRSQGLSGRELVEATTTIGKPLLALVEPAVIYFHRLGWRQANREDLLRHLTEDSTVPAATPGESEATVMFIDLASFTPLTIAMGDVAAAEVLQRFGAMVRSCATAHAGRIVKQIGDAFMLVFAKAEDAVSFGLAVEQLVEAEPQFPVVHIGAHTGTVLFRDGDYVGAAVNLAARVASAGGPGQFLITQTVREAAGSAAGAQFTDLPPRPLKGVAGEVGLVDVRHASAPGERRERDPVCGMQLDAADIAITANWQYRSYVFCSETCHELFAAAPVQYAALPGVTPLSGSSGSSG